MNFKKIFISVNVVLLSSCASIVSTSQYPVKVDSSIPGATVSIKDKLGTEVTKITTPATVNLSSGGNWVSANYMFEFEKEGYESVTESIAADINGWYWGNLAFGGLIGLLLVDPATGAMWKLRDHVSATMYEKRDYAKNKTINVVPIQNNTQPPNALPNAFSDSNKTPVQNLEDISIQLKKLKQLKDSGVLNPSEYESKRKALVEKL